MRRTALFAAMAAALLLAASAAYAVGVFSQFMVYAPQSGSGPQFMLQWAGSGRNNLLLNFLAQGKQPGFSVMSGGANTVIWPATNDYLAIANAGYKQGGAIESDAVACAVGGAWPCTYISNGLANMEAAIDQISTYKPPSSCTTGIYEGECSGAIQVFVNEPCLNDPNNGTPVGYFTANASWSLGATSITVQGALPSWIQTALTAGYPLNINDTPAGATISNVGSVTGSNPFTITLSSPAAAASNGANDALVVSNWCSYELNAKGMGILKDYINSKGYNMEIGISDSVPPSYFAAMYTDAQNKGYTFADFIQPELFNSDLVNEHNYFAAFHASFPTVLRYPLITHTYTYCSGDFLDLDASPTQEDQIGWYDVDQFWADGPLIDPIEPENAQTAAISGKAAVCNQTTSITTAVGNQTFFPTSVPSWAITDTSYPGWTSPYTISTCDYQVYSGANALNGLTDPSVVQTYPDTTGTLSWAVGQTHAWASRSCNPLAFSSVTIGSGLDCRNELDTPITGYVVANGDGLTSTLHVTSGTFTNPIGGSEPGGPTTVQGPGLFGSGVTANSMITAQLSGTTGQIGAYTVNQSQTVGSSGSQVSMSVNFGFQTCLIVMHNENNSPRGYGDYTYNSISIAY